MGFLLTGFNMLKILLKSSGCCSRLLLNGFEIPGMVVRGALEVSIPAAQWVQPVDNLVQLSVVLDRDWLPRGGPRIQLRADFSTFAARHGPIELSRSAAWDSSLAVPTRLDGFAFVGDWIRMERTESTQLDQVQLAGQASFDQPKAPWPRWSTLPPLVDDGSLRKELIHAIEQLHHVLESRDTNRIRVALGEWIDEQCRLRGQSSPERVELDSQLFAMAHSSEWILMPVLPEPYTVQFAGRGRVVRLLAGDGSPILRFRHRNGLMRFCVGLYWGRIGGRLCPVV